MACNDALSHKKLYRVISVMQQTGASATLGKASLEAQAKFTNGMAYYRPSETGILLDASLSGTKYWKSKELNDLR